MGSAREILVSRKLVTVSSIVRLSQNRILPSIGQSSRSLGVTCATFRTVAAQPELTRVMWREEVG